MTGRDLIIYILENNLENTSIVKDEKPIGLITIDKYAALKNVGTETVKAWILKNHVESYLLKGGIYIPVSSIQKHN